MNHPAADGRGDVVARDAVLHHEPEREGDAARPLLGFAFVSAWIAFDDFGSAILCLLGAAVFYLGAAAAQGDLDLAEVQRRLRGDQTPCVR